jgi:hypothetical protein
MRAGLIATLGRALAELSDVLLPIIQLAVELHTHAVGIEELTMIAHGLMHCRVLDVCKSVSILRTF